MRAVTRRAGSVRDHHELIFGFWIRSLLAADSRIVSLFKRPARHIPTVFLQIWARPLKAGTALEMIPPLNL
jgi:hypothetical protein